MTIKIQVILNDRAPLPSRKDKTFNGSHYRMGYPAPNSSSPRKGRRCNTCPQLNQLIWLANGHKDQPYCRLGIVRVVFEGKQACGR